MNQPYYGYADTAAPSAVDPGHLAFGEGPVLFTHGNIAIFASIQRRSAGVSTLLSLANVGLAADSVPHMLSASKVGHDQAKKAATQSGGNSHSTLRTQLHKKVVTEFLKHFETDLSAFLRDPNADGNAGTY